MSNQRSKLVEFLVSTPFRPLIILGNAIKGFGLGTVVAFLLGAAATYGYSQFESAPFHVFFFPPPKIEEMTITGTVNDWDHRPVVSALAYVIPPGYTVSIIDGKFEMKAAKSNYTVLVTAMEDPSRFALAMVSPVESIFDMTIPPGLGSLAGHVEDSTGKSLVGSTVCVEGGSLPGERCVRTNSKGDYLLQDIPAYATGTKVSKITAYKDRRSSYVNATNVKPHITNLVEKIIVGDDPMISGLVTDRNNYPIPNAWVSIDGQFTAVTSYDGRYAIAILHGGAHRIEVSLNNRVLYSQSINVTGESYVFDVRLP
jgi:hypothetical protein